MRKTILTRSKIPHSSNLTRRTAMALGLSGFASLLLFQPAQAMTSNQAEQIVSRLVGEINQVIGSDKPEGAMVKDFEKIFVRYADVPFMARYALGVDGRSASKSQINSFTRAFQGYIATKYGRRFREFIGGRLEVKSSRKVKSVFEVKTVAFLQGQSPFEVTFQLSDRSGSTKFVNMFIEGVNLLLTERTEIGAMWDKRGGNLDRLTKDL